jgi:Uma2 family endonuclease
MKAGTRLFWVLYPESRTVHVFRHDGTTAVLTENDELRGDDVLPEFVCRVSELFEGV